MRNPSIRLTRHLRRTLLVASPLALVVGLSSGAQATTYAFAFSDTSAVLQAYGTLTTANALNAKGGYDVLSIGGFANSSAITGLVPNPTQPVTSIHAFPSGWYFTYDNVLYAPGAPHVDIDGILFNVGGTIYEIYSPAGVVGQDVLAYYDANKVNFVTWSGTFSVTPIGSDVPEAATWALALVGFGMIGGVMRGRARTTVSFA